MTAAHGWHVPRRRTVTVAATVLALAGLVGIWFYRRAEARDVPAYRLATIDRGNLERTVSATGTLTALRTVQVGTQVSGQIAQLYVDFNDRVKRGQLLARIDPTMQQQAVLDAQAGLERSEAELAQAQREHTRNAQLYESRVLAAAELETSAAKLATTEAARKSARIALDRAERNLSYTAIHAPIDGIVVERNVDVGQTVAASLSAPQLFLIANDLSRMQILASVDEADIGTIRDGVPVRFTVQSYPSRSFTGAVKQVRLQSTTRENVVNYTVVVAVANPDGQLLPGMTATARFVTDSAIDVLTVPNAALRFRPSGTTVATSRTARGDSAIGQRAIPRAGRGGGARPESARRQSQADAPETGTNATLWTLNAAGTPEALRVRAGLSDGQRTAVAGPGLDAGLRVIVGMVQAERATTSGAAGSTNPLQPVPTGGPRRPGGF
jgi:HlyD family secretion protein